MALVSEVKAPVCTHLRFPSGCRPDVGAQTGEGRRPDVPRVVGVPLRRLPTRYYSHRNLTVPRFTGTPTLSRRGRGSRPERKGEVETSRTRPRLVLRALFCPPVGWYLLPDPLLSVPLLEFRGQCVSRKRLRKNRGRGVTRPSTFYYVLRDETRSSGRPPLLYTSVPPLCRPSYGVTGVNTSEGRWWSCVLAFKSPNFV